MPDHTNEPIPTLDVDGFDDDFVEVDFVERHVDDDFDDDDKTVDDDDFDDDDKTDDDDDKTDDNFVPPVEFPLETIDPAAPLPVAGRLPLSALALEYLDEAIRLSNDHTVPRLLRPERHVAGVVIWAAATLRRDGYVDDVSDVYDALAAAATDRLRQGLP